MNPRMVLLVVLLFGAAALAAVAYVTRDPPSPPGASAAPSVSSPAPDQGGLAAAAEAAPLPSIPPSPPPAVAPQMPIAAALRDPWDTVPIVGRSRSGFGRELEDAIRALEAEVSSCWNPEVHARFGPKGFTEYGGQDGTGDTGEVTLMLEIEADGARLRIADAPIESRGTADEEVLACAQHTLRGKSLAVAGAKPGARYKARLQVIR